MSAFVRRSPPADSNRKKPIPVTPPRRSRRLAGLPPAPPAPSAYTYIGTPDVTDEALYDRLMGMVAYVIHRIFLSGDSGRFRPLTNAEAVAWVRREHDKSHIWLMREMISGWMAAPIGNWRVRHWEEKHVEIAMRQHPRFMAALEAAMGGR
jgi:hypothetical protein